MSPVHAIWTERPQVVAPVIITSGKQVIVALALVKIFQSHRILVVVETKEAPVLELKVVAISGPRVLIFKILL